MAGLVCDIVTPQAKLYSGEATMVVVPGIEGQMGYLYGHVPLVSVLADGVVRLLGSQEDEAKSFVLQGGYVEVTGKKVIVLADRATPTSDIQVDELRRQLADLEEKRAALSEEDAAETMLASDIDWCKVQLNAMEAV